MAAKYGNNSDVDILLNVTSIHDIVVREQNETLAAHVNVSLEFLIHQNESGVDTCVDAVILEIVDLYAKFNIGLSEMNATLNIVEAS